MFDFMPDDVVMTILEYLSPEEKIGLTVVSEQFNRCLTSIRRRTKFIRFANYSDPQTTKTCTQSIPRTYNLLDPLRFQSLLRFYPRVERLEFIDFMDISAVQPSDKLTALYSILCCDRLISVKWLDYLFTAFESFPHALQRFIDKFGDQFEELDYRRQTSVTEEILQKFSALKSITTSRWFLNPLIAGHSLRTLNVLKIDDKSLFERLIKNSPDLDTLKCELDLPILYLIPKLTKLKSLSIILRITSDVRCYGEAIKRLGSLSIRRLKVEVFHIRTTDLSSVFKAFEAFSSLTSLEIMTISPPNNFLNFPLTLNRNYFKNNTGLQSLIIFSEHLTIDFFKEMAFKDLKVFIGRAKHLLFNDKALISSVSPYLHTYIISSNHYWNTGLTFEGVNYILDRCRYLKKFSIDSGRNHIYGYQSILNIAIKRNIDFFIKRI